MFKRPVKEINAEFVAEDKYLRSIQSTVRESCVAAGMSRKDTAAVLLAIEEAATNIIRHAYLYEKGTIRLRVVVYRKLIVFSMIDFGRSYQPDASGTLDLDRLVESGRKGGLGFYMIQKIMDSVQYISSAGRNELRMIKRIGERSGEGPSFLRRMFTLRAKFSLWTFLLVAMITGVPIYYMDYQTSRQVYDRLDGTVHALAETIADQASTYHARSRSHVEFDELVVSYKRANPELTLVVLTDAAGRVVAHSDDYSAIRKPYEAPPAVSAELVGQVQRYSVDNQELNYLALPVQQGKNRVGLVHVIYSSQSITEPLTRSRHRILLLTVLQLVFGVICIYILSNHFVRPIVKITQRVRRFASGDLESELPLEGAEEFFEISKAFNEIMTRLSRDRKNIIAREKMAKEIEVASQIQHTLMPSRLPELRGLQLDAVYRAASVVSGDLYDVFEVAPDRFCLVVADVSGKGVPASLVMSMLRTVIQIQSRTALSARGTLLKVNEYLEGNMPAGMFITVMLAMYDATDRSMELVSAGHNPMLLWKAAAAEVRHVNPAGMPLGVPVTLERGFEDSIEQIDIQLEDDDLFFMFTDGITEAVDRSGEQFGIDRLASCVARYAPVSSGRDIPEFARSVSSDLDEFVGFEKPADDITFIVARAPALNKTDHGDSEPTTGSITLRPGDD